jgi:exodeoxyribonuclease VII large subunit
LQGHRSALAEAAAVLRPNRIARQIGLGGERTAALGQRLVRVQHTHLAERRTHLETLGRVLDSSSYRSALERGFALVRGADGTIRRRAAAVSPGEHLTLTFADGEGAATADGAAAPKPKSQPKPRGGQGSLF